MIRKVKSACGVTSSEKKGFINAEKKTFEGGNRMGGGGKKGITWVINVKREEWEGGQHLKKREEEG